jgi:hypothetical protein
MYHVPEVDEQTEMRHAMAFPIVNLRQPGESVRATWLVRSPANPAWHGLERSVPAGKYPLDAVLGAAATMLSVRPRRIDPVRVIQPGDIPGITQTTFVHTMDGIGLPHPRFGLEAGAFPLDDLPDDLDLRLAPWLQETLEEAVTEGLSPYHAQILAATAVEAA